MKVPAFGSPQFRLERTSEVRPPPRPCRGHGQGLLTAGPCREVRLAMAAVCGLLCPPSLPWSAGDSGESVSEAVETPWVPVGPARGAPPTGRLAPLHPGHARPTGGPPTGARPSLSRHLLRASRAGDGGDHSNSSRFLKMWTSNYYFELIFTRSLR